MKERLVQKALSTLAAAVLLFGTVVAMAVENQGATGSVSQIRVYSEKQKGFIMAEKVNKTEEEWKKALTADQFHVLRRKGTERAFSGDYWKTKDKGVYKCAACGQDLFASDSKFDSGTGWPSFWKPIARENVATETDVTYGMTRTEVVCSRCGGHLGHVFSDGPEPTGLRYCINSISLKLEKAKQ